jgi:GntR family transcriptional regulator / MocR family aminotransferase
MGRDRPVQMGRARSSLLLRLVASDPTPLHTQLYEQIRVRVLEGDLAAGAPLPSSRRLAAELGVSRTTVIAGLDALLTEGYLTAHPRSAIRVAHDLPGQTRFDRRGPGRRAIVPRLSRVARARRDPPGIPRLAAPPRAFRPGVPALDLFPMTEWARVVGRSHTRAPAWRLEGGEPAGHRGLREAIAAEIAAERGIRCRAEQVFVTTGMQQAIDEVLRLVVDPGDAVWVEDPGYLATRRAVVTTGAHPIAVSVDDEGLDVETGIARAAHARAVVVTPSHHYPLGVTTSLPRRMALLAWAARRRAVIVEDDYDSEFRHRGRPLMSLAGLDEAGCVVYAGSFSKTLFPGLRIGFAIAPPGLVDAYAAARRITGNPASILEQDALAQFIGGGGLARHLRRMRLAYRERAEAFAEALRRHCAPWLTLGACDTGMQACARLEGRRDHEVRRDAAAHGVEVGALSDYFLGPVRRQGLVFGFGCVRPDALRAGCRTLAEVLAGG